MALSPPYRATPPPPEDVSGFDAGEATPPRTYLLAGRLFAGGLGGSALILLAISSFAVGIGAVSLLPRDAAPARPVQIALPKPASAKIAAAAVGHKLTAERSSRARAHKNQSRPRQVTQGGTSSRPTTAVGKDPSTPASLAAPTPAAADAALPAEASVAASTQELPATDPVTIDLQVSNVVDTIVSTVPALPALPALPPPLASVVTTATTLVGIP